MNGLPRILLWPLLAGLCVSVQAAPWTVQETPHFDTPADFLPTVFSESAADGFWALGTAHGDGVLIKFDAAGNPLTRLASDRMGSATVALLKRLPDGGLLLTRYADDENFGCLVTRLAADGRQLWQAPIANDDQGVHL